MDDNLNPYAPEPAPEAPAKLNRRLPRAAIATGLAVGLGLGAAGLAYAATSAGSSVTPAASKSTPTTTPPGPKSHGPLRAGRFGFGGLGRMVHGTVTIRSGSGFKTVDVQIGQVLDVSKSSITVQSPDGFKQTYSVLSTTMVDAQAGGISSVGQGDQVALIATPKSGAGDAATNIVDTTKMRASRKAFGFGPSAPRPPSSTSFGWYGGGGSVGGPPAGQAQ